MGKTSFKVYSQHICIQAIPQNGKNIILSLEAYWVNFNEYFLRCDLPVIAYILVNNSAAELPICTKLCPVLWVI